MPNFNGVFFKTKLYANSVFNKHENWKELAPTWDDVMITPYVWHVQNWVQALYLYATFPVVKQISQYYNKLTCTAQQISNNNATANLGLGMNNSTMVSYLECHSNVTKTQHFLSHCLCLPSVPLHVCEDLTLSLLFILMSQFLIFQEHRILDPLN